MTFRFWFLLPRWRHYAAGHTLQLAADDAALAHWKRTRTDNDAGSALKIFLPFLLSLGLSLSIHFQTP